MPSHSEEREQRLRRAGLIREDAELPPEYVALIEGLTPDEVEVLIAVRKRIDEAERVSNLQAIHIMMPP
jgi:hypothetical protein